MRKVTTYLILVFTAVLASTAMAASEDATEIMKKSHLAYYYAGNDGLAEVGMTLIDKKGKERSRQFSMLRLDVEEGGNQKYYTYFKKPSDVSRLTFMVHKTSGGNDARWIYVPAVDLVKPISADDKNSSFVGSDFSYEDVSGRHWMEDNHTFVKDSALAGAPVYVIESVPKESYKGFSRKLSYIDKTTLLPMKEEYYDKKGNLIRVFKAEKVEVIDGIATVTVRSMEDVKKGSRTVVSFSSISYNIGIEEDVFTERYLKSPPRKFIK
ncbi:MAG: outer membrane lipoprotein-sorting protein [Candidatus Zixiibacteriota bacterium]|nr:MAG: outer membrane lipoprotein-sorting protein [candidate division Zixibacteria bacterium]